MIYETKAKQDAATKNMAKAAILPSVPPPPTDRVVAWGGMSGAGGAAGGVGEGMAIVGMVSEGRKKQRARGPDRAMFVIKSDNVLPCTGMSATCLSSTPSLEDSLERIVFGAASTGIHGRACSIVFQRHPPPSTAIHASSLGMQHSFCIIILFA